MSTFDYAFGVSNPAIDQFVQKSYPGLILNGQETPIGAWSEIREVGGFLWLTINAAYNAGLSGFTQQNTAQKSSAIVIGPTGSITQYTAPSGATSPITWTAASPAGIVYASLPPYSPDGTYTNDASSAIQSALNATPAGGICFLGPGTFKINTATLTVPAGIQFLMAPGTILKGTANPIVSASGVQGVTVPATATAIEGGTITPTGTNDGMHVTSSYFAPAAVGRPATITRVNFDGSNVTTGTLLACTGGEGWSIIGCSFSGSTSAGTAQAQGLSFAGCTNFSIVGCVFKYLNGAFVAGKSGSNVSQGAMMLGCDFNGCYRGIVTTGCDSMNYTNCLIDNCGIPVTSSDDFECSLSDSYVGSEQAGSAAIIITNSTQNLWWSIQGCRINTYVSGGTGVSITGTAGVHANSCYVSNNRFSGSPAYWIQASYIGGCHFDENVFANNASTANISITNNYGSTSAVRNVNYNPVGFISAPAVAASGTAVTNTNPWPVEVFVAANGATITGVSVNGTSTGLTSGWFLLEIGDTITLTYTGGPPTWQWKGN